MTWINGLLKAGEVGFRLGRGAMTGAEAATVMGGMGRAGKLVSSGARIAGTAYAHPAGEFVGNALPEFAFTSLITGDPMSSASGALFGEAGRRIGIKAGTAIGGDIGGMVGAMGGNLAGNTLGYAIPGMIFKPQPQYEQAQPQYSQYSAMSDPSRQGAIPPQPGVGMPVQGLPPDMIKRAQKRAEEQALLNQFYADALAQQAQYN